MIRSRSATAAALAISVLALAVPAGAAGAITTTDARPACPTASGVVVTCGIDYAGDGKPEHTLNLFRPAGSIVAPVVFMIHGGGWKGGSAFDLTHEATYFAQNGLASVSIAYTLSLPSQASWPTVLTDVETALGWVVANGGDYQVDGTRLAAFGPSAGGHLASLVDTRGRDDGHPVITAVSLSGIMDLKLAYDDGPGTRFDITRLLGCNPDQCISTAAAASPVTWVDSADGSLLFFNSQTEIIPLSQATEMDQALTAAGVQHKLVVLPGSVHARGYECAQVTVGGQQTLVIDASLSWIARRLLGHPITPTGTYC